MTQESNKNWSKKYIFQIDHYTLIQVIIIWCAREVSEIWPEMVARTFWYKVQSILSLYQLNYLRCYKDIPNETLESKCFIFLAQILQFPNDSSRDSDIKKTVPSLDSTVECTKIQTFQSNINPRNYIYLFVKSTMINFNQTFPICQAAGGRTIQRDTWLHTPQTFPLVQQLESNHNSI
jgi:hypothetical protein